MTFKRALLVSLLLTACGDDDAPHDDGAVQQARFTLCDGSGGVRLSLVTAGGGPLPDSYAFSNPYGWRFLYVDGKCNFVASSDVNGQLLTGTFTAEQSKTISETLDLDATAGVVYRFQGGCPDAPASIVTTPYAYIESTCGDDHPPTQVAAALAWEPVFTLAKTVGRPSTGSVSILALPSNAVLNSATLWPFSFSIAQATYANDGSYADVPAHAKSLTGADAALARQLWSSGREGPTWRGALPVTSEGKTYELYFRDDIDPAFAGEISTFKARYDVSSARPVARCDARRMLTVGPADAGVYGHIITASVPAAAPCAVELCWDGAFAEKSPVGAHLALQAPAEPRTCIGPPHLTVSADMQPMLDAYRASYPRSAVVIDLGFGTLYDAEGDDAICRALSAASCADDPRCLPIAGTLNDAARQCTGPSEALGCGAKYMGCGAALTGGQAPDGRRAIFTTTCIPAGWTAFYGEAPDYALPACAP